MSEGEENRLDIIVFGATGFTGKYTLLPVHKLSKAARLTWGIAGRSQSKLEEILIETADRIGIPELNVPIIIADVNDEKSIQTMASRAKVIINCCGPFQLYGEMVVKACIDNKTNMVDVTGEMQYMEEMVLKYNEAAKKNDTYIISACGFDCVPSDIGVLFMANNFEGTLNSVEVYLSSKIRAGDKPPFFNFGTWESLIRCVANFWELNSLYKKIKASSEPLPKMTPKLNLRLCPLHRREDENIWAVPFVGGDNNVIQRSQRHFYLTEKKRPIQTNCYLNAGSFLNIILLLFGGFFLTLLSQFKFGLNLLLKYPKFFTLGYVSHKGPSEETIKNTEGWFKFYGLGWEEKLSEPTDQFTTPPNKLMITKVGGKNPGYGITCTALALSGILTVTERHNLPQQGGVYSTAAAFANTSFIKQLQENGLNFEILSNKKIVNV